MAVMVRVLDLILHIRGCRIIEKGCGYTLQPHEHQEWNEKGKMDCTDGRFGLDQSETMFWALCN